MNLKISMQTRDLNKPVHYFARSWRSFEEGGFVSIMGIVNQFEGRAYLEIHINVNEYINTELLETLTSYLDKKGHKLHIYNNDFFNEYAKKYGLPDYKIEPFKKWEWIYHILLYHYLYNELGITYLTTLDDDLIFEESIKLNTIIHFIENRIPFSIQDQHWDADKPVMARLCALFGPHIFDQYLECYSNEKSGNSGFMGINNDMFHYFNTNEMFLKMIEVFEYKKWDHRTMANKGLSYKHYKILLQEQSFLSILNRAFSYGTHIVLGPKEGLIISSDINELKKSKIRHFIGTLKYTEEYANMLSNKINRYRYQISKS